MHPSAEKVARAAEALGIEIQIVEFPQTTRTAEDAATAIGCQVGQIVKSLVFLVNEEPVIALVSGQNRLDVKKLAELFNTGRKRVRRADADQVKSWTGFSIGGVPPFSHSSPLPVYVDHDLFAYSTVWAAAGTPFAVFEIEPGQLLTISGGQAADLKIDPPDE